MVKASDSSPQLQRSQELQQQDEPQQQQHGDTEPAAEPALHNDTDNTQQDGQLKKKNKKNKMLSQEKLRRLKEQHDKRGIVYISR
jgi:hypothetical protein